MERLLCFDLGGVIVRICRSWEEGCAAAQIDPNRPWTPVNSGGRHHELVHQYTIGAMETDDFFAQLEALSGSVYSAEEFRRIHCAWTQNEYPGVLALLEELRERGHTLACLSNTNAAHWEELVQRPVLRALHHRHASHLIGHAKPDERIYSWFADRLGRAPEQIVFFDDLDENIRTARRLGWDGVPVDHTGDTASQIRRALRERSLL